MASAFKTKLPELAVLAAGSAMSLATTFPFDLALEQWAVGPLVRRTLARSKKYTFLERQIVPENAIYFREGNLPKQFEPSVVRGGSIIRIYELHPDASRHDLIPYAKRTAARGRSTLSMERAE